MSDQDFYAALAAMGQSQKVSAASFTPDFAAANPTARTPAGGGDICGTYKQVRPILVSIEPLLKGIPVLGPAVANAIQQLMNILDAACGVGQSTPTLASPICATSSEFHGAVAAFAGTGAAMPTSVSPQDICKVYMQVKPILDGIVPFLTLIPTYGVGIAAGIKALMMVLDSICKTS